MAPMSGANPRLRLMHTRVIRYQRGPEATLASRQHHTPPYEDQRMCVCAVDSLVQLVSQQQRRMRSYDQRAGEWPLGVEERGCWRPGAKRQVGAVGSRVDLGLKTHLKDGEYLLDWCNASLFGRERNWRTASSIPCAGVPSSVGRQFGLAVSAVDKRTKFVVELASAVVHALT